MVALVGELRWVRDRLWNSERFIVFQTVILQQDRQVTTSHAICRRIEKRLEGWEAGRLGVFVEENLRMCTQYLTVTRREESDEHRSKTYHILVL